jgi:hypothetical protein
MAQSYAYAAGRGLEPIEHRIIRAINKYGAEVVYGRPMGAFEIRILEIVQNIVNGKLSMDSAENLVEWKTKNEYITNLVSIARREALTLGLVNEND